MSSHMSRLDWTGPAVPLALRLTPGTLKAHRGQANISFGTRAPYVGTSTGPGFQAAKFDRPRVLVRYLLGWPGMDTVVRSLFGIRQGTFLAHWHSCRYGQAYNLDQL